jgi:ArsR family metal-binding transcriptional regulator
MLVNAITLTRTYPCLAEPDKIVVVGEPDVPIDGVLPLFNAILPNVVADQLAGLGQPPVSLAASTGDNVP